MFRQRIRSLRHALGMLLLAGFVPCWSHAADVGETETQAASIGDLTAAERGYRFLTETAVLSSDFDQATFDALWTIWPNTLRQQAETATLKQRRQMAFQRYGLTTRPDDDSGKPLQYVVDASGNWTMNCFACHGGTVYGKPMPGSPNNRFALQTLTEEIGKAKIKLGKLPGRMELGALFIPLGTTNGTTNAVVFGMGLMNGRDAKLNVVAKPPRFFTHHDMDAPAWWHFHMRPNMYIDGFAKKGHRGLMQFTLVPENGPDFYHQRESDFEDVYAYLDSLRPPKYTGEVDVALAESGRKPFNQTCADCHGRYDQEAAYPNRRVALSELGTDPVRLTALTRSGRQKYADSWFAHAGEADEHETVVDPDGYVAPPLNGVWASAPYFHNGSVPTLWHVLNPTERPTIWRPISQEFDAQKVGLSIQVVAEVPKALPAYENPDAANASTVDIADVRSHFDTRKFGKSNQGHDFPDQLTDSEKAAVLEYLKTL